MSDYRRLISYIYAYEGGVKGKNIGYAKIEVRNGQCRIQVNVKKVYVGSNEIGVYLLAPGEEIFLGRIFVRGGAGEFRIQVKADNIEGSGCGIERCYGLTVHDVDSAWRCYTTIWEDAVAQAAELELGDVTAENARRREEPEKAEADEAKEAETPPELPISDEIERELEREEERMEAAPPWEEPEEVTVQAEETAEQADGEEPGEVTVQAEETAEPTACEEAGEPTVRAEETSRGQEAPEPEDMAKLKELDRLEQENTRSSNLWNRLERQYTKVLAFDYDNGCEILSIKPQDIGLLPREIWVYGNNSFLLHGYYNYRHLILARLNNPQGAPRYLLGVPGHYFSNEKYMASMFGFPHFVLAKKQPEEDGRFGYWYTDIRI